MNLNIYRSTVMMIMKIINLINVVMILRSVGEIRGMMLIFGWGVGWDPILVRFRKCPLSTIITYKFSPFQLELEQASEVHPRHPVRLHQVSHIKL